MSIRAYELVPGGLLRETAVDDALMRLRSGDGAFWIDAGLLARESLEPLLDSLGVSRFIKTRCLRVGHSTVVVATPSATFATFPSFADRGRGKRAYGAAVCLPNALLTFHTPSIEDAERVHQHIDELEIERSDISHLLCALLMKRVAATASAARDLRDEATRVGELMDADPTEVDPVLLEDLKRRVILLDAVATEQREAMDLICHATSPGFDTSMVTAPLGLLATLAAANDRLVERTDGRIDNLIRRRQDHKTELLNRRLGLLTIVSAIFLPLSLLAGIWGMNFENMPELGHPYAYGAALTLMAAVGLGSIVLFYKRGWFD